MKGYKNSPVRAVPGENKQYSSHLCVFFMGDGERKKVKKLGKAKNCF